MVQIIEKQTRYKVITYSYLRYERMILKIFILVKKINLYVLADGCKL